MTKKYLASLMAALVLSFGASTGSAATMEEFNTAWDAADAKRKEAASLGFEWRDTGKMLKSAKKKAEEGDLEGAMKSVAKALEQGEDAVAQAMREEKGWASRVPQ